MRFAQALAAALEAIVGTIGRLAAWLVIPLVAVILLDLITRRWLALGSIALQELEWHLHTALFALVLGHAYLRGAHVRLELLRERLGPRARAWIEVAGCVSFLIPFTLVTLHFGIEFARTAHLLGERSPSSGGLGARWLIKAVLALGLGLLLLAGIAMLLRQLEAALRSADDRR